VSRVNYSTENFSGVSTTSTGGSVPTEQVRIYDQAIADLSQVIRLDPNNAVAYINRGMVYSDKGDYDRAIEYFSLITNSSYHNYVDAYYTRGLAYYAKGNYDRAIADWEEVLRVDPNDSDARKNIELARQQRGR
jgi:tetratricopeptide (TPR) repeat protein